ncbi:MAG: hypothetical protein H0U27_00265 [Nitrosopumilus sp.]|jgi:hypothetical protein|nr:hypothetical protein [Nitrosopumilus sp.]MBA3551145.1 hypothetical protein [Patescibacteria group bacterium]
MDIQPISFLRKIGLKKIMIWKDGYSSPFSQSDFNTYTSKKYDDNNKLKDADEVYGFNEIVKLHKETGLRINCSSHEDYFGTETEYKVLETFIFLQDGKKLYVTEMDLENNQFITEDGPIPFSLTRKTIEPTD